MSTNQKVLTVHMAVGLDLIVSKTSLHASKYDIEATPVGIQAKSRASGRVIVIPYSNVRGFELLPESGVMIKNSANARTEQAMKEAHEAMVKRGEPIHQAVAAPVVDEAQAMLDAQEARANAKRLMREQSKSKLEAEAVKK